MNETIISGRLTADIETREVKDHTIQRFQIACNDLKDEPLFLACECWNMNHLPRFLSKGSRVLLRGNLRENRWKTKDGETRSRLVLAGRKVEFLDPRKEEAKAAKAGVDF